MPRYLLQLRKTSFFLIFRSSDISFGSNKASSMVEATWHPMPPLKSLSDASSLKGSPSNMGAGSQACGSRGWVSDLFMPHCDIWLTFCCFVARWASSSRVGRDLPVSTTSFPFCFLLLFGLAGSGLIGWGAWGGDFEGGGGSLGWVDFPSAPFLGWSSISSIKLFWGFLWIPISSDMSSREGGWLNTSNSSKESVRSTTPFEPSSSSSSSFLPFLKNELGRGCSYRKSGHKQWLSTRSTSRNWDTLWNNEPLIGNTDTVELRIGSFDYILRGLECEWERCVPKN